MTRSRVRAILSMLMAFPDQVCPAGWERVETHISWVFLGPEEVFKIKKPVNLGFLDFTTSRLRRAACEAEVRLNRRLAPHVYLGVVPITSDEHGTPRIGGDGEPLDWAVHMRRVPDAWRSDLRLAAGQLTDEHLEAVALRVASFHANAAEAPDMSSPELIAGNVRENFEQTRETISAHLSAPEATELEDWQLSFLRDHDERFRARADGGHVREGHGDLRLEHVYLDEENQVIVLDCIEFNERFRWGDTASDVAFLSMDLAFQGRVDLAERFLALYAREANDFDLYGVVDFYEGYRAHVRAKIASFVAHDPAIDARTRERAAATAHRYYKLAISTERASALRPAVVAVGGPIASGKSTVSTAIGARMSAPVVDTDRTRKYVVGKAATENIDDAAFEGAYSLEVTARVYDEMIRRARVVVESGRPVVLDASFRSSAFRRRAAELASELGVPFWFVECRAPTEVLRERLTRRDRESSVSDGRLEVLDDFLRSWEPVRELGRDQHQVADTTVPLADNLERLAATIPMWPAGLAG